MWIALLALIAANVAVFAPVCHYNFVSYDDPAYVSENPHLSGGVTWAATAWAFTTGYAANWHPLTWLSHMLDVQAFGLDAGLHHLTSLLLHIANTLLLFWVLYRMTGALGRSVFAAALFAVHPLHVESVAWVAERKDVLSTLFWMLTLWAYLAYVRRSGPARYLVVVVLFGLGLLAKPMVVTLPFVLLLLDVWPLRRAVAADPSARESSGNRHSVWVRLIAEKIPLFALSAASCLVTFVVQRNGHAISGLDAYPLLLRMQNALAAYVAYIGKMIWPTRLAAPYPYPHSLPGWWVAGAAFILLGVSVAVIRRARRFPYLAAGWFWYLGTLVPVIGIVQVGTQSMADRYTYVPLVGLFIMVAWGVPDLLARAAHVNRILPAVAIAVILGCAVRARDQVRYWENSVAFWGHTLETVSDVEGFRAHVALGTVLERQGRIDEAIAHYSESARLKPDFE